MVPIMQGFFAEFTLNEANGLRMTALRMPGFFAEFTLSEMTRILRYAQDDK